MLNTKKLLFGLATALSVFEVGNVSGAIAQSSTQIREIRRLNTGEEVLAVPSSYLLRRGFREFREALQNPLYTSPRLKFSADGSPIIYNNNQEILFLRNGNKLTFVGYGISTIYDFQVDGETYWASLCSDYTLCYNLFVSKPNMQNLKKAKGIDERLFLLDMRKDVSKDGFFYIDTTNGNGLNTTQATYLVNLSLPITSPNKSVVACEVSRYTNLRSGGTSPIINNPNCQNGRQVSSVSTTIPSVPPSSSPVKPTDTIARYPTNDDFEKVDRILQASNPESLVNLKGNQQDQRRKFKQEWENRNPAAVKFLGGWYTGNKFFYVYPSTVKGGTCVVTQDANSKLDMKIGVVLNKELRYGGGKGFFWIDRANIVASRDSGAGDLYPIYATSEVPKLSESMIGDMERQKCITTLP